MTTWCNDDVLDAALSEIADNCNLMTVCNALPTTRDDAVTTYALGNIVMASGDFILSDGDTSGRKLTIGEKDWFEINVSDTGIYIALVDTTRLLYVVPCDSVVLTSGGFWSVPSWEIEILDPV